MVKVTIRAPTGGHREKKKIVLARIHQAKKQENWVYPRQQGVTPRERGGAKKKPPDNSPTGKAFTSILLEKLAV